MFLGLYAGMVIALLVCALDPALLQAISFKRRSGIRVILSSSSWPWMQGQISRSHTRDQRVHEHVALSTGSPPDSFVKVAAKMMVAHSAVYQ